MRLPRCTSAATDRAVGQVGPATASAAMFLVPAFGLSCAWVLLGESISAVQGLGAGLMFVGAWLNTRSEVPREARPQVEQEIGPTTSAPDRLAPADR